VKYTDTHVRKINFGMSARTCLRAINTGALTLLLIALMYAYPGAGNHAAAQVKKTAKLYYWSKDIDTITYYDSGTGKHLSHSRNLSFPRKKGVSGYRASVSGWLNYRGVGKTYVERKTNYATGVKTTTFYKKKGPKKRKAVILYNQWFSPDHKAMLNKDGIHVEVFEYNKNGQNTGRHYLGLDFKPCENTNGIHRVTFMMNSFGYKKERAFFNLKGEKAVNRTGIHRTKYRYRGKSFLQKYVAHYGPDGEKAVNSKGAHRYKYDKKRRMLVPYGPDGKEIQVRRVSPH